ncbi:hypothetical protein J5277_20640 [Rhizobium sp. 16-449-1b]|uniref:hypothetical protein n=1 Tax=Rhizobium sp. 16-449-1b TaxID=2819989 RepID=UPI001ADC0048|nr:hypothetical protein [Rhizobium sp. 16-449-1b]MBO9196519.1 hypothetical protein [Rhizobium sp. 16-449-1b]
MKYEVAEVLSEQQVIARVHNSHHDDEIIRAVLSAVYWCEPIFTGLLLLRAFAVIDVSNRHYLGNVAATFLRMHRTDYLADDILAILREDGPNPAALVECIEAVEEFRSMFAGNSAHLRGQ